MKKILALLLVLVSFGGFAQTRNCGTMRNLERLMQMHPEIAANMSAIENATQAYIQNGSSRDINVVYNIPVVVHVVYNTTSQNITDAQIQSQIAVLNEDFRRLNADKANTPSAFSTAAADAEITFCLATVDPNGNPTNGITRTQTAVTSFSDDDGVKSSATGGKNAWNTSQYLNLWVCNLGGGLLGYAQFPGGPASTDGVVINYQYFGRGYATVAPYNKGRTGTHEVGHWLNLRHIWGDASCGDDLVSDTPTQSTSNYSCPTFPHRTCGNTTNGDMFMNYMDYTDDPCMNMFTTGQKNRMRALFTSTGSRVGLLNSNGCGGTTATCNVPASLTASSITTSSATLSWGAVSGATSYNVQYKASSATTWTATTSTTNSKSISGLAAGTTYQFQVSTVCSGGSSAYSTVAQFTTTTASTGTSTTITVGSGTSSFQAPFGTYYMDEKTQFIITRTELVNGGYTSANNQLKSIAFNVATNAGQAMNGFSIKVGHTTSASYASGSYLSNAGLTTVYTGTVTPVTGWNTFNFATPFTYNGTDNLVVEVCWDNSSYTNDTKVYATTMSTNQTVYAQQDVASGGMCGNTAGTATTLRPNTTLVFNAGSTTTTCGVPASLAVSSVTSSSATLSWGAVSGATSYSVRYKSLASTTWITSSTTSTSKAISGLTASTSYEFQVSTVCSGGSSAYSASKQFSTTVATTTTTSTVTVGAGTSSFQAPFGTYYMDEKSQFIITRSELINAGYTTANSQMRSIAFNVVTNAGQAMYGFSIKVGHTTAASYGTSYYLGNTGMTTVYSGTVTPVAGWNTFNFTTPFNYNGTDNLVIEICWDNSSYTTDTKVYATSMTTYQTVYKQSDVSAGGMCTTTTGTLSYLRPNTRMVFGTATTSARAGAEELVEQASPVSSLNLYPNPAKDVLYLDYSLMQDAQQVKAEIYSLIGTKIVSIESAEGAAGEHNMKFDLNAGQALPAGMYLFNLTVDGKTQTRKFVIAE
jgi:hypothetical protein